MLEVDFKIPVESSDYKEHSDFVVSKISSIIESSIRNGDNKIFIYTNLKRGLPLENINKVAGPFIEAWALEKFEIIAEDPNNITQVATLLTDSQKNQPFLARYGRSRKYGVRSMGFFPLIPTPYFLLPGLDT